MKWVTVTRSLLRFRILFPVISLLLILPMVLWLATAQSRRVAVEVQRLVREMHGEDAQNQLIALGPKKDGELRRILLWSDPWYSRIWNGLPSFVRDELPDPGERAELRDKLQLHLKDAGPVICRATTGAICTALERCDSTQRRAYLLSALVWSIPESERAVTTLSNLLVGSTNTSLDGLFYDVEFWPKVSHLAPLLAQSLHNENAVIHAVAGLAHIGTNAAFAVPLLVEVAEKGVANGPVPPSVNTLFGWNTVSMRRIAALHALAKIGITNSAVIGAINKAAETREDDLCSAAYLTALELEVPITGDLRAWAESWNPIEADQWNRNDARFFPAPHMAPARIPFSEECEILRALGNMGSKASPAVSLLTRIASNARTNVLPHLDDFERRQAVEMRLLAISALYKLDPQQAAPFLQFVLKNSRNPVAIDLLSQWHEMREQIVPAMLEQVQNSIRPLASAFILHGIAPDLEEPRRVLETGLLEGHPEARATALNWLWRLRQNPDDVLPAARELLTASNNNAIRSALKVLEQMGESARPAVPEIKALLTSKDSTVRDRAGRLLRRLFPADMPPIIE